MSMLKEYFKNDLGLEFNEADHIYKIGDIVYPSVSSQISNFYEKFDTENTSATYALKHNLDQSEVKQMWANAGNKASAEGTIVHNTLEHVANALKEGEGTDYYNKLVGGLSFLTSLPEHIKIVDTEIRMVNLKYKYAGTCDLLLLNTLTNKYIIADYKTNKNAKLFYTFRGQKLKKPFNSLKSNSYNKYQIQLSLYQIMLEDVNIEVEDRWLVWLNPEMPNNHTIYKTTDYTNTLRKYYDNK